MLFSSRKPLYFVFHDRSERYFQDSTLQLTFSEWLWLTLRKRGYSNIYFVDLDDTGRPVLTLRDRDTWRGYTPGGIFSVMGEYRGRPLRRVMGDKEFLRLWNRIYDGPGDCAYVFSAQSFSRLASVRRPKDVDGLLDRMARQERPDALILTGPMDMEASDLDAYLNPHGILAYLSPTGRSLCQAAADLLQREQDVCFFEKLKERLGDQFIELGRPTYGRLLSMLRCVRFALGESWDEDTLEFYALLLLRWVHMRTVKSYCKGLFSDLPKPVTCAGMYALLCRDRAEKLRECAAMLRRTAPDTLSSAQMLEKKFGPLPQEVLDQCWISVREPSLDKLLSFQLPHISSQTEDPVFQICPVDPGDWYLMRRRLRSPRLCPPPKERIGWIAFWMCSTPPAPTATAAPSGAPSGSCFAAEGDCMHPARTQPLRLWGHTSPVPGSTLKWSGSRRVCPLRNWRTAAVCCGSRIGCSGLWPIPTRWIFRVQWSGPRNRAITKPTLC